MRIKRTELNRYEDMTVMVIFCIVLFRHVFGVPFVILGVQCSLISFLSVQGRKGRLAMSNKVKERREAKIAKAVEAENWKEVDRLLQQEQSNAERRDRYHHKKALKRIFLVTTVNNVNARK